MMTFFQGASGVTISGGEFNEIAGDLNKTYATNTDSYNTTATTLTNSNNVSSSKTTNTDSFNTTSETLTYSNNDNSQRLTVDPASQHTVLVKLAAKLGFLLHSEKVKPVKQGKKSGVW